MLPSPPSPPVLVRPVIVERAPVAVPSAGLTAGLLVVTFRLSSPPGTAPQPDARVAVSGLGPAVPAQRADFSTAHGNCLQATPAAPLKHWKRGRQVTVRLSIGNGAGDLRTVTRRVAVTQLRTQETEQSYATTVLGCFSIMQ
jgi:hypothetical protein